ncbi:hypothetical protein [Ruminococcus flavefaciens]|uniref:hypothetical protein n=1 Tax=Ruminococcus flavefaciens TaxID=1265 RepID=UPI0026ED67D9|nr:hypothetical protein [Ruminococcus flavefaciens]
MAKTKKSTDTAANTEKKRVNKDVVIRARVTLDERERFEKKAAELGFSTVSDMIRSLIAEDEEPNGTEK